MIVGTVRELKPEEHRVGMTPDTAHSLVAQGHVVLVECGAGAGSGFDDADYQRAGAKLVPDAEEVWSRAGLILKVKEPQPAEFQHFRPGLILFTYLHLAAEVAVLDALLASGVTGIAAETVREDDGSFPMLVPMSEIAGRMAVEVGAQHLRKPGPGRGVLLSGLPGVRPASVVILGDGTVGRSAARQAAALGARVTLLGRIPALMREIELESNGRVTTIYSTPYAIEEIVPQADLLVAAVLLPGARAPVLVSREIVRRMRPGSVIVDVAIDQGGCVETSRPTTHDAPVFVEEGVVHYGVSNMPGAVPRTATAAMANSALPYVEALAEGLPRGLALRPALASGVNTYGGRITHPALAQSLRRSYTPLGELLAPASAG